jgi:glyoxylase-like metal-dependent hydrolase (beta-lactamase superfamily II)
MAITTKKYNTEDFLMIIKNIYKNLYEADFAYTEHYTKQVIYFILEDSSALIIDTGYEKDSEQLEAYLKERNIQIEKVIISHYHDDHFSGLKALKRHNKNIEILGSSKFKQTLEKEYSEDFLLDSDIFPTMFCDNHSFIFGGHQIRFEEAGGHSDSSLHIFIDDKYVHVGDNIIFATDGMAMLPLPYASIKEHINTLEKLKENQKVLYLGSHFSSSVNLHKDMRKEIDARIKYMELLMELQSTLKAPIGYDKIKDMLPIEFNPRWHDLMLLFLKEQQEEVYETQ